MVFDREETDPRRLATMVEYVRRQVQHMDTQDSEAIMDNGTISLVPFSKINQRE